MAVALGGVVATGVILAVVGLIVKQAGIGWVNWLLPPVVTGSIVMIIGLNLAGAAKNNFVAGPEVAAVTLAAVALIGAAFFGETLGFPVWLGVGLICSGIVLPVLRYPGVLRERATPALRGGGISPSRSRICGRLRRLSRNRASSSASRCGKGAPVRPAPTTPTSSIPTASRSS